MTQTQKFHETVGVLVDAYINDTLVHGHPCGCAVGNLIAYKLGAKVCLIDDHAEWYMNDSFNDDGFDWFQFIYPQKVYHGDPEKGNDQIEITGYSIKEIIAIESAFESVVMINGFANHKLDPDGYKGLMMVVNVLAVIHSINL